MRLQLAFTILLVGCYQPSPPAGSYRCASDDACPSSQHCTCGLCVDHDDQAACSFTVAATVGDGGVGEHEPFALHVQALAADGKTAATGFAGTVTLSSSWGDVRVAGAGATSTVTLQAGQADAMVTLNRETLPPQTATVSARFGDNKGASNKVAVTAAQFARAADAVVPVPSAAQPYGFADTLVAQPDVQETSSGWRMYFGGLGGGSYMFGAAQSSDGITYTPVAATSLFSAGGAAFDAKLIESPSVFYTSTSVNLAFSGSDMLLNGVSSIGLATSSDGLSPFSLGSSGLPILAPTDCGYCDKGVSFPAVIADPAATPADGGGFPTAWLMFFSASSAGTSGVTIGRASSSDGLHFTPEPAPLLTSELGGEAVLLSPRVLVDGTVFKMWYSYASIVEYKANDVCGSTIHIGYATSDDGFYWIRSPSNPQMPIGGGGWDGDITAFLVGSVVPTDGSDPQNGITLYYSTLRNTATVGGLTSCLPNGIGRATRR